MEFKLDQFNLVVTDVPGDGHCLFHSLLLAFFTPYITETYNSNNINRLNIVQQLRSDLADKLSSFIPGSKTIRNYDLLYNKNINYFAEHVEEFTLVNMQKLLKSNNSIGYGYLEFICNQINKDVYIIDGDTQMLYKSDESPLLVKGRMSIVLYYQHHHYQLVGLKKEDKIITHFKPTNSFILYLKSLL